MRLIEDVLKDRIKPVFKQNAHPKVNLSTGRVLSGATGGELAYQDYYEGQIWKQHPGIANVVEWCIRHLNVSPCVSASLGLIFKINAIECYVRKGLAPNYPSSHDVARRL